MCIQENWRGEPERGESYEAAFKRIRRAFRRNLTNWTRDLADIPMVVQHFPNRIFDRRFGCAVPEYAQPIITDGWVRACFESCGGNNFVRDWGLILTESRRAMTPTPKHPAPRSLIMLELRSHLTFR